MRFAPQESSSVSVPPIRLVPGLLGLRPDLRRFDDLVHGQRSRISLSRPLSHMVSPGLLDRCRFWFLRVYSFTSNARGHSRQRRPLSFRPHSNETIGGKEWQAMQESVGGASAVLPNKSATAEIRGKAPSQASSAAEIEGVDLRRRSSPPQFKIVHDALVQYEVIVLRDHGHHGRPADGVRRLVRRAFDPSPSRPNLAEQAPRSSSSDYSDIHKKNPASADRHLARLTRPFRETPPLGNHPGAAKTVAGGRRTIRCSPA